MGSYLSDWLAPLKPSIAKLLPVVTASGILAIGLLLRPVTDATIRYGLATRILVAVTLLAPASTLLGFFFPTGLRLVAAVSEQATPWMWGVNGAFGVLGSIVAVGISIWIGIQANLLSAVILYGLLVAPLGILQRAAHASIRGS